MLESGWFGTNGSALLPLMGSLALMGGGGMFLLWIVRTNYGLPARRLDLMRGGAGLAAANSLKYAPGWQQASAGWYAEGLNQEERWQIVRSFAKLDVPASRSLAMFAGSRSLLALSAGAAVFLAGPQDSSAISAMLAAPLAILGWILPMVAIRIQLKQHRQSVGAGLPEALELLAVCVGAGLSLDNALKRVSAEVQASRPALADELALTWAEISISPNRDRALANMAERVNLPAVRSVIGTLSQSLRMGTPLAQSLRMAASEMRNQQLIELEEKANRLPAMLTVPVMLFIMPSMLMILGGPAVLKLMDMLGSSPH